MQFKNIFFCNPQSSFFKIIKLKILLLSLTFFLAVPPMTCKALTLDEFNSTLSKYNITAEITTIAESGHIKNLVIGDTIYDVDFIRSDMDSIWGSYIGSDFETNPMFWGKRDLAYEAANEILQIVKSPHINTHGDVDNFFVPHGEQSDSIEGYGFGYVEYGTVASEDSTVSDYDYAPWEFYRFYTYAKFSIPLEETVYDRAGIEFPDPITPVPAPNTLFLLGLGLLGIAGITRRK